MLPISNYINYISVCGWKYFPFNRGLVSGLIIAGYGFGAFTFNFVTKAICNPNDEEPTVVYYDNGVKTKYFDKDVYEKVPFMF